MKFTLAFIFFFNLFFFIKTEKPSAVNTYDPNYVEIRYDQPYKNDYYDFIVMRREGNKVKAKYFAQNYLNIGNKYRNFANGKNVILYAAAGYLGDGYNNLKNFTIENGVVIQEKLDTSKFDALVIIYATGGIAVSNLRNGDLKLQGSGADPSRKLNIRNDAFDKQFFIDWCKKESATVFQTHLLAFNNQLTIPADADVKAINKDPRERRFLIVGKDKAGILKHVVINRRETSGLRAGAEKCFDYVKNYLGITVSFMINLDTGAQNVFNVYNSDGTVNADITKGSESSVDKSYNLLVYYYE